MAALTLRNVPEDLLRDLREAAENDRRNLNRQIIHILHTALRDRVEREMQRTARIDAQVAAWRRLAGRWVSDLDRATEAKQLMRRRTRGRRATL